jgi:hypothetical protein
MKFLGIILKRPFDLQISDLWVHSILGQSSTYPTQHLAPYAWLVMDQQIIA